MRFHIPIHSIVDVITNSSSVLYTEAHQGSVDLAKKLINKVLSVAGTPLTADDLFNISVRTYSQDGIRYYIQSHHVRQDDIPDLETFNAAINLKTAEGKPDYAAQREAVDVWEKANQEALEALFEGKQSGQDTGLTSTLIVTTKDGVDIDFAKTVLGMFDISEVYDG
jgi:hypothetical protein